MVETFHFAAAAADVDEFSAPNGEESAGGSSATTVSRLLADRRRRAEADIDTSDF